ncbi:MAG: hypothetical protein H6722_32670 [Sandaracinus sp.]|nr:hypothetical protein [Sandaracinus sp.]
MRRPAVFALAALACLVSCSKSRERGRDAGFPWDATIADGAVDTVVPAEPEEIRAYLEALADAQCRRAMECESVSDYWAGPNCHPARVDDWMAEFESGGSIDVAAAAACLEATLREPCDTWGGLWSCGLAGIVRGAGTAGDRCLSDLGCDVDHACVWSSCPTCEPRAAVGEPCDDLCALGSLCAPDVDGVRRCLRTRGFGESCGVGDLCWEASMRDQGVCDAGRCRRAREGESCNADLPCEEGLRCNTRQGVCEGFRLEGEECGSGSGSACVPELLCVDRVCQAPERVDGATCRTRDHCPPEAPFCTRASRCSASAYDAPCASDADCGQDGWCAAYRCVGRAELGGPCGETTLCPAGSRCSPTDEGDRCLTIVGPNERCGSDRVCPRGFGCEGRRCEPLPVRGEACTDACALGACLDGVCAPAPEGTECQVFGGFFVGFPSDSIGILGRQCEGACSARADMVAQCRAPAAIGESCSGGCEPGAICDRSAETPRCVAYACE